ncbi:hypothetical protein B0T22DRAFT_113371 [Podospora appendiculata]|uniref:CMP/dCMP-type deaminase domain-containing protein n=1 Tax=Podospora appendiculata TaxID=314037 RepID=A0AAE0XLR3_9PEZI|nr:hypothetical protein B0T22DRAFT_113371 [Podospora appendiculata]
MTVPPPKAAPALSQQIFVFLHSLLLLLLDAFRQALKFFSTLGQADQKPALLSSSDDAAARESRNSVNVDVADACNHNTDANPPPVDTDAGMDRTKMASSSSSSSQPARKRAPVPKIIPALPLVPLLPKKENSAPPKPNRDSTTQLNEGLARLVLNGAGSADEPRLEARAGAGNPSSGIVAVETKPPHGNENGGSSSRITDEKDVSSDKSAQPLQEASTNGVGAKEVTRAPAVPLAHEVSQTSKLKETVKPSDDTVETHVKAPVKVETPEQAAERAIHSGFMREALDMARLALKTNETPVGCVLVCNNRVVAKGMNATNVTRNGTRHAELMAISALLSYTAASDVEPKPSMPLGNKTNEADVKSKSSSWGDVDPRDGHLFPYGQKLHPSPVVDRSLITQCTLYVTVEPCVMCASLLRQFGIKKVFFGAVNDKFGGTGGVFRIHKNSEPTMASCPPSPTPQNGKGIVRPTLERRPVSTININVSVDGAASLVGDKSDSKMDSCIGEKPDPPLPGDGGNVEPGYEVEGGWGRDEAVTLLRQFYVQENGRAPVPRKKEGRAARLAAMMERDGHAGGPMTDPTIVPKLQESGQENEKPEASEPTNTADEDIAESLQF